MQNILIYSHQLFENNKLIINDVDVNVYLIEHPYFFTKYDFNINKKIYHKATTLFYYDYLKHKYPKINIVYVDFKNYDKIKNKLYKLDIIIYDPIERELCKELKHYKSAQINSTPLFLSTKDELEDYNKNHKTYLMNTFYMWSRKKLNLFVDKNEKPYFGKWSFDKDNRNKFPKDYTEKIKKYKNKYVASACKYFKVNIDDIHCWLPITFTEIKKFFKEFIKIKLINFGDYEDAISSNVKIGNHSLLSSVINIGMLTPGFIIGEIKKLETKSNFKQMFNSIEGFVRQIIGWREYMRYVYLYEYENLVKNSLGHKNRIKDFDNIVTDIQIIDDTIQKVYTNGWTHHIERLMILGNYFFLCKIHPDDVYKFFYEKVCLDAYDWVMVGNVYGMSQYASKIKICSKPYFCSSNYLLKMSNYSKGDWCYKLDCLFYNFVKDHYSLLKSNYSTAMITKMYDKNENKIKMCKDANNYIKSKFKT